MRYIPDIGWLHTLDPFAIQITNTFGIRWYGLAYLAGFLFAYLCIRFFSKRKASSVPVELVGDLVFTLALGAIIGGRLGYCLLYSPDLFFRFTSQFPFWGALAIHEGGMASHGGIAGIIVACFFFARKHNLSALHLIDLASITAGVGVFFGRLANFVNGELLGREAPLDLSWSLRFPQEIFTWPSSKLSTLATLSGSLGQTEASLIQALQLPHSSQSYSILEAVVSGVQSGNRELMVLLAPLLTPRYPSQLIAALFEGLFVFIVLIILSRKQWRAGILSVIFVFLYGCGRLLSECFRLPDIQIGYQWLGLTRGQWLSIGFLGFGILLFALVRRHSTKSSFTGGWASQGQE